MNPLGRIEWKPNPKQALFLSLPETIKEAFYGGGNGSGKSDVLLVYSLVRGWYKNPRFKQVLMRRTMPELKREIVPRSKDIFTKFGATFNNTDMVWTFPREDQLGGRGLGNMGSMIFLGHCENEDDVHKYDSMEISLYTPDELTTFTEWIYNYIGFERTRSPKDSGLPSLIRAAGVPGGIGHTFVKKRFVDPYPSGGKIIVGRGGNKRIYIHATLADNIDHIDPTYAQTLEGLPEAQRKAKKFGDWSAYLGQVFDEFRDKRYLDEPENALHVVEPFDIPYWWPRIVIGDWGYRAMTYIAYGAISPNKRVYVYREQYWTQTKIEEWAPFVKEYIDKENPRVVKFCRSAGQDRGQEHTVQEQISNALGVSIELTSNAAGSRVAGKALLHEYLRWKPKYTPEREKLIYSEELAMHIMRNKGMEAYREYNRLFDPPIEETNLPKLQIFNTCPVLVNAIKACSYDKPKDNKPAEDVAEFDGDDPYDTIRYLCDTADAYFDESAKEFEKIKARDNLVQRLAMNNDWTAFYRNNRQLEALDRPKSIPRFHRLRGH
jgi:hypothetical protein